MGLLSYTKTLVALAPENVGDLNEFFANIRAWANGQIDSENLRPGGVAGDRIAERTLGGSRMSDGMLNEGRIVANDVLEERMLAPALRASLVRNQNGNGNLLGAGRALLPYQVATGKFSAVVDHALGVADLVIVGCVIAGGNIFEGVSAVKIEGGNETGFVPTVNPVGISPGGGDTVMISWMALGNT